jgi:hypothetical protein
VFQFDPPARTDGERAHDGRDAVSTTRRSVVRTVTLGSTVSLAGCGAWGGTPTSDSGGDGAGGSSGDDGDSSGSGDGDGTESTEGTDPDAGTDSYGVLVENDGTFPAEVTVTAGPLFGETRFDETETVASDATHEWDGVVTDGGDDEEPKEWGVNADVSLREVPDDKSGTTEADGGTRVDMRDSESLPEAENVVVKIFSNVSEQDGSVLLSVQVGFPGNVGPGE